MSTKPNPHPEFELHEPCVQRITFMIERLDYDFKWRAAESAQFKSGGRYILYDQDFTAYLAVKEVGPYLEFQSETMALNLAKALVRLTDRPLRVERIQTVRIQRQIGKTFLPTGGI